MNKVLQFIQAHYGHITSVDDVVYEENSLVFQVQEEKKILWNGKKTKKILTHRVVLKILEATIDECIISVDDDRTKLNDKTEHQKRMLNLEYSLENKKRKLSAQSKRKESSVIYDRKIDIESIDDSDLEEEEISESF